MSSVYFAPAVGGNGTTVTDDSNATTGLGNGGHRTRFVPALAQVVAVAGNAVGSAQAAAAAAASAAANAATALNAPGTQATSTTSLAVGLGSKSLTLAQTGKAFVVGQYVQIVNSTSAWMAGLITAFTPATGAMTVNVTNTGGSGTLASWTITPTNPPELPSQSGNSGKALTTDGSTDSWAFVDTVGRSARTANTSIGLADRRKLIDITSGTFTQTFDAAATLGDGWWCYIRNSGSGDITLDPNGSETIDGLTSFVMYPGEARLVQCDGAALRTIIMSAFSKTYLTSGTFSKPPGYKQFAGLVAGAGGGGGGGRAASGSGANGGGGGGGAVMPFILAENLLASSETVTIGSGGSGGSVSGSNGGDGGNSFFAFLSAYGGGGGGGGVATTASGGAGGGWLSAGIANTAGSGSVSGYDSGNVSSTTTPTVYGGSSGGSAAFALSSFSKFGGGGGGNGGRADGMYSGYPGKSGTKPNSLSAGNGALSGMNAANETAWFVGGGGGGGATINLNAGNGGNGGPASGGGGGGGTSGTGTGGAGGAGGNGLLVIYGVI